MYKSAENTNYKGSLYLFVMSKQSNWKNSRPKYALENYNFRRSFFLGFIY